MITINVYFIAFSIIGAGLLGAYLNNQYWVNEIKILKEENEILKQELNGKLGK